MCRCVELLCRVGDSNTTIAHRLLCRSSSARSTDDKHKRARERSVPATTPRSRPPSAPGAPSPRSSPPTQPPPPRSYCASAFRPSSSNACRTLDQEPVDRLPRATTRSRFTSTNLLIRSSVSFVAFSINLISLPMLSPVPAPSAVTSGCPGRADRSRSPSQMPKYTLESNISHPRPTHVPEIVSVSLWATLTYLILQGQIVRGSTSLAVAVERRVNWSGSTLPRLRRHSLSNRRTAWVTSAPVQAYFRQAGRQPVHVFYTCTRDRKLTLHRKPDLFRHIFVISVISSLQQRIAQYVELKTRLERARNNNNDNMINSGDIHAPYNCLPVTSRSIQPPGLTLIDHPHSVRR